MSQKVNILHVLNSRAGVDVYVRYLCQFLPSEEYNITIVRSIYDGEHSFKNDKDQILKEYRIPIVREISFLKDVKSLFKLLKIIKQEKPNFIHCHSAKGGVLGRIAAYLMRTPVVYTPHAFSYLSSKTSLKGKLFLFIEKLLRIKKGKGILLACAETEAQRAITDINYDPQVAKFWSNSIPEIETTKPTKEIITIDKPYACTIGRPSYQKNLSFVIDALSPVVKAIPDFQFIIMGIGHYSPEVDALKAQIQKLKLQNNITLVDWTDREHILDILSDSLFYVTTSLYEGLPYSLLEAMVLSKPPIASNIDGNTDLITDGENGYLFELDDINALSNYMIHLYKSPELRDQLGRAAKDSILENNSLPRNIATLKKVYSQLIDNA